MKVLWFTNTPSLYKKQLKGYNGVGWVESLEKILSQQEKIELGLSFFYNDSCFKNRVGNTTYYPLSLYNSKFKKLKHYFRYKKYDKSEIDAFKKVVNDFNPDIIHVFGSEKSFGLIAKETNIPVIIHIQGLLNPCLNAYYPPGVSGMDVIKYNILNPFKLFTTLKEFAFFKHNAKRENIILKNCKYFMGRTEWDKNICALYAPESKYFYCSEALRDVFYEAIPWKKKERTKLFIVSTLSETSYKGMDVIMKTAQLLNKHCNLDFEWNILGITEYKFWERKLGFTNASVNIKLRGVVNAEILVDYLKNADMFVHPSYIDNSPNSVCEAQLLGLPVIAANVGGVGSLIEDGETGVLVPANDPFTLTSKILNLNMSADKSIELGKNGRHLAMERHNKDNIQKDLFNIYNQFKDSIIDD